MKVMLFSTERLPKETHKIFRYVTTEPDTRSGDKKVLLNFSGSHQLELVG